MKVDVAIKTVFVGKFAMFTILQISRTFEFIVLILIF